MHAHAAWLVYTLLLTVSLLVWHIAKVLMETLCIGACSPPLMHNNYPTNWVCFFQFAVIKMCS